MQRFCKTIQCCPWKHHEGKQSGGTAPLFLNHGTRWMELSASRSGRLTPGERSSQYPLNISLGGIPEPVWMFCRRQKCPRIRTLHRSAHSLVARPTSSISLGTQERAPGTILHFRAFNSNFLSTVVLQTHEESQSLLLNVQQWCAMLQYFCLFCAVVLGQLHSQLTVHHSQHTIFRIWSQNSCRCNDSKKMEEIFNSYCTPEQNSYLRYIHNRSCSK